MGRSALCWSPDFKGRATVPFCFFVSRFVELFLFFVFGRTSLLTVDLRFPESINARVEGMTIILSSRIRVTVFGAEHCFCWCTTSMCSFIFDSGMGSSHSGQRTMKRRQWASWSMKWREATFLLQFLHTWKSASMVKLPAVLLWSFVSLHTGKPAAGSSPSALRSCQAVERDCG